MLEIIPIEQSAVFLERLSREDAAFDWEKIFSALSKKADPELEKAIRDGKLRRISLKPIRRKLISSSATSVVFLALGLFFELLNKVILQETPYVSTFSTILVILGGISSILLWTAALFSSLLEHVYLSLARVIRAHKSIPDKEPIKALAPSPISYQLRSSLGPEGELLAVVSREIPTVIGAPGKVHYQLQTVGKLSLGTDESTAELVEHFNMLSDKLDQIEQTANGRYHYFLKNHLLAEEHIIEEKLELERKLEQVRERKSLNQAVVSSLNQAVISSLNH